MTAVREHSMDSDPMDDRRSCLKAAHTSLSSVDLPGSPVYSSQHKAPNQQPRALEYFRGGDAE